MTGGPVVVLDACVMANFSLVDTLLRLAEAPRLYEPRWSEEILQETVRTLVSKLGWPQALAAHLQSELRTHFAEAWVGGYESLLPAMANEEEDRHVLAAAAHCHATAIVTFNLRHFRAEHLIPWRVVALHPAAFLLELYRQEPATVARKLKEQAGDRARTLSELLGILDATVPSFVAVFSADASRG